MNRRVFLQTAALSAAWTLFGKKPVLGKATSNPSGRRQPNIIVIMSDEHNAKVLGCYGNKLAKTPNMDMLAKKGVVFENAYTNSPLCVPSRLSFTSGKYISRVGAWSNKCWLPSEDFPSLPRLMTSAGYESILCGKMHYDKTRRYGFREIGGNMNNNFKTGKGRRPGPNNVKLNEKNRDSRFKQFHPGNSSSVLNHDRRVTASTCNFLKNREKDDKPLFMLVGYLAPHFPLIVPEKYWDHYKGKVPMPVLPEGHVKSQVRNYQDLRKGFGVVKTDPAIVRKGRELYYGLTEWLDNEIGKVLKSLEQSEIAENTIVVYTTDHGENMGEHALWWKNCMYEQAAHVPLIIKYPKRWYGGQRRTGTCSLVDLVQTIAELGEAKTPSDWNGDSLCKVLQDPQAPWKDMAVSEYYAHNIESGFAMIRMGRYKYVYHTAPGLKPDKNYPAEKELYDLKNDPCEFTNLALHSGHQALIKRLHTALVKELGENPEKTERRCLKDYSKGYNRKNAKKRKNRKRKIL